MKDPIDGLVSFVVLFIIAYVALIGVGIWYVLVCLLISYLGGG